MSAAEFSCLVTVLCIYSS